MVYTVPISQGRFKNDLPIFLLVYKKLLKQTAVWTSHKLVLLDNRYLEFTSGKLEEKI
jgi:hypothetical protein